MNEKKSYTQNLLFGCLGFILLFFILVFIGTLMEQFQESHILKTQPKQTAQKTLTPAEQAQADQKIADEYEREYDKKLTPAQRTREKKEDADFDKGYEKYKQQSKKTLNDEKYYIKTNLDKLISKYDFSGYYFHYYIDPYIWDSLNIDQKTGLFNNCAEYTSYDAKNKNKGKEYSLRHTDIKNYSNGDVLGRYIANGKYNFK